MLRLLLNGDGDGDGDVDLDGRRAVDGADESVPVTQDRGGKKGRLTYENARRRSSSSRPTSKASR